MGGLDAVNCADERRAIMNGCDTNAANREVSDPQSAQVIPEKKAPYRSSFEILSSNAAQMNSSKPPQVAGWRDQHQTFLAVGKLVGCREATFI